MENAIHPCNSSNNYVFIVHNGETKAGQPPFKEYGIKSL